MLRRVADATQRWLGPTSPLRPWHLAAFALQCVALFVSYQHSDIGHTGGAGFVWLSGHVRDFYDHCKATAGLHNYLPSTTLAFAVWDLPLWLFGVVKEPALLTGPVLFWFKLLPTLVMLGCVPLLVAIGKELGLGAQGSKHLAALWFTSPIALFSQFVFGQYDVFTVFCFLWATLFYLRGRLWWFAALAGVAFSFKYFPVFPFVPMVLVAEKRVGRVLLLGLLFAAPAVLEALPYLHSQAFREGVLNFGAATRPLELTAIGGVRINVLLAGWLGLCVFAYQLEPRSPAAAARWALHLGLAASCLMFASVIWHPQWLIFLTPLLAISAMQHRSLRLFLLLEFAGLLAFLGFTGGIFPANVDFTLAVNGVWGGALASLRNVDRHWLLKDLLPGDPWNYFSVFVVVLCAHVLSRWPGRGGESVEAAEAPPLLPDFGLFSARAFALVPLFLLPTVGAYLVPSLRTFPKRSPAQALEQQTTVPVLIDSRPATADDAGVRLELGTIVPGGGVGMTFGPDGARLVYEGNDPSVTASEVAACAPTDECVLELDVTLSGPDTLQVFVAPVGESFNEPGSVKVLLPASPTRVEVALPHTKAPLAIRIDPSTRTGAATLSRAVVTRTPRAPPPGP